jgi:hypothetical protein
MAIVGKFLYVFGGRTEGRGRFYANDLWKKPVGRGDTWLEEVQPKKGEIWPVIRVIF